MSLAICYSAALPILTKSSSTLLQMPIRHFFPELQRLCVIWISSPKLQHTVPDAFTPLLQQQNYEPLVPKQQAGSAFNAEPQQKSAVHAYRWVDVRAHTHNHCLNL
ncbi:uncharacterized [Tachysurus ichikawai]